MYSPKVIIGATHVPENIQNVQRLLDGRIQKDTRVGSETHSYPVDRRYMHPEFADFFDGIGDFVTSEGGIYIPLGKIEDKIMFERNSLSDEQIEEAIDVGETLERSLKDAYKRQSLDLYGEQYKHFVCGLRDNTMRRMMRKYRFNMLYGLKDDTMLALAKENEPEIIVVGGFHVPTFAVPFPDSEIIFSVTE